MTNIIITKEYKYLGEYPLFKEDGLPVGYLIDKGKVGCGGTSIALEDGKDTIICVPFVSLIKNKMQKYNTDGKVNVLGVYEGVTTYEIREYLNTKEGAKKIMCTYDSLAKVAGVTGYNFFLLIDELHLLFIQYVFRNKAVRTVLDEYTKFKEWSFLTATPIEYDLMLEELKDIPTFKIDWEHKTEVKVNAVQCKYVGATVKKVINDFLEGKVFGNAHFFVNSVEFIATMIKNCNLTNENTRIIFSKNNETYKHTCQGVTNGETTDPVKKINFYTSTCFEGCDLFDTEGKIYIISESTKAQTLMDISTQVRQIVGRIRDTQYADSITHLYKATRYNIEDKIELYKCLLRNAILIDTSYYLKSMFIRYVDELHPVQILFIKYINCNKIKLINIDSFSKYYILFSQDNKISNLTIDHMWFFLKDLERRGLIYVSDNLVHPEFKVAKTHERYNVRSKEPILDQPYISINELGIQFLEMIKKDITED